MKKVYTAADLKKAAKKLHLEIENRREEMCVYTPKGYHFISSGSHVLCEPHRGVKEWKIVAINRLMEEIVYGLKKCPKDCECME